MSESIVILGAARTPMSGFQGDFVSLAAPGLCGAAIRAAAERALERAVERAVVSQRLQALPPGRLSAV
jgi:acetyl-CoA acetyltransferase